MSSIDFRDGSLRGRLAGMVGASWKGIQYIRKMVIPANPNTAAQQGTRTVFAYLVETGRRINSTILKNFILPKPKKSSPFNEFISRNKSMISNGVVDKAALVIGDGSLFTPELTSVAWNAATNNVDFDWSADLQGEAKNDDIVILIAYNETTDTYGFKTTTIRADTTGNISMDLTIGDQCYGYMFIVQGDDLSSITSQDDTVVS